MLRRQCTPVPIQGSLPYFRSAQPLVETRTIDLTQIGTLDTEKTNSSRRVRALTERLPSACGAKAVWRRGKGGREQQAPDVHYPILPGESHCRRGWAWNHGRFSKYLQALISKPKGSAPSSPQQHHGSRHNASLSHLLELLLDASVELSRLDRDVPPDDSHHGPRDRHPHHRDGRRYARLVGSKVKLSQQESEGR